MNPQRRARACASSALCGVLAVAHVGCESGPAHEREIAIPQQEAWLDCGPVLTEGKDGDWDRFLWGGFALAVVKKAGTYFLYYQGARFYDEAGGTVAWRSIGVATSTDGVHFRKYEGNPVLTWAPRDNLEEGAVSAAVVLDESNRIAIYYGANTWAGGDLVNADVRLATSEDGLRFRDAGMVLAHGDGSIWGSGDELFPLIGIRSGVERFVYYLPNGSPERGLLGVAWGDGAEPSKSARVADGSRPVPVWGPGGAARIGANRYALVLSDGRTSPGRSVQVRTVMLPEPTRVSAPVVTYHWDDVSGATVLLDEQTRRWLLYYINRTYSALGVKVATVASVSQRETVAPACCEPRAAAPAECN